MDNSMATNEAITLCSLRAKMKDAYDDGNLSLPLYHSVDTNRSIYEGK
jgi:hypothetical protein